MKYEAPDSERLEELFHALSELDAAGRKEFLDANCSDDPVLRDALEKLLHADEEATETALLSTSALHLEARDLAGGRSYTGSCGSLPNTLAPGLGRNGNRLSRRSRRRTVPHESRGQDDRLRLAG